MKRGLSLPLSLSLSLALSLSLSLSLNIRHVSELDTCQSLRETSSRLPPSPPPSLRSAGPAVLVAPLRGRALDALQLWLTEPSRLLQVEEPLTHSYCKRATSVVVVSLLDSVRGSDYLSSPRPSCLTP